MKKSYQFIIFLVMLGPALQVFISCNESAKGALVEAKASVANTNTIVSIDTTKIPDDKYGDEVRYGRELMLHTAYYIGPNGINGKYLGNKMNCSNCQQDAGAKPYSLNLAMSFRNYPGYRAREGRVLSLAERINNCIMHPHLGKPLPLDSKEMVSIMCYLKWLNDSSRVDNSTKGIKNLELTFPDVAASPERGNVLFAANCARCHGLDGEGKMQPNGVTYIYPPLWGPKAYQPGSSMHRIVKLAQWLMANMPYDKATYNKPVLTSADALDLAAFINDDKIHKRPFVKEYQYPNYKEKAIDYDRGPFNDTFSDAQHKYGPYKPIIDYWESKGMKPTF